MNRFISIFILLALTFLSCKTESQERYILKKKNAISKIPIENGDTVSIQDLMSKNGLKGLSVAVFEDYKIVWADTWGVKHDSVPLDKNTAFSTASISKAITAVLFVVLEEKGLIDLTVPVNTYLKRWKIPQNEFNKDTPVTLEHLLSHTAGTTQHGFSDFYEGDEIPTILESVQGKLPRYDKEIEITFKPGTNWNYSGGGYTIAMMAMEDHLGKSLADLAQEYLFDPLKLKGTTMKQPNEVGFLTNVAKVHNARGEIIRTGIPITPQVSASGLWSNPTEMSILIIEIQKAINKDSSSIFSAKTAQRITDVVTRKTIGGWSLGWERMYGFGNLEWFSHGGANTGVGGNVYATMEGGKGIVFFGNGPNDIRIPLLDKLKDNIIKTHGWKKPLDKSNVEEIPESLVAEITGRYEDLIWGGIARVEQKNEKIFFIRSNEAELFYVGDNTFMRDEFPTMFKFSPNANGKTEIFNVWDSSDEYELAFRKIIGKLPFELAEENNYAEALLAYQKLKKENPSHNMVQESTINRFGYEKLGENNYGVAITIFRINVELYSNSANVYDSLAEAYMLSGDKESAIDFYKKSLELNPKNTNAVKMIEKMIEK